jgi:two-component system cell cycle response regulator
MVEDDGASLELMRYLLCAYGHTVDAVTHGVQGLEALQRERPDLVVCDIQLPGIDGYEIARRARADSATRRIPMIAVTAMALVGDRERILAAGFDRYVSKPISPQAFVDEVNAALGLEPAAPPARRDAPSLQLVSERTGPTLGNVLVVDDSPLNRELLRNTLGPSGYVVGLAGSVAQALERMRNEPPPDLILSDLHMAVDDGFDFLSAVKSDAGLRELPFLFISSSVWGEAERQRALELGATRFLLRPIEPQALLAEITKCFDDSKKKRNGEDPGR